MDIKEAETVLTDVSKQVKEQKEVQNTFEQMKDALYNEKTGAIAVSKDTNDKIGNVDPSYALQLAVNLNSLLKQIPALYEAAKKFVPKQVREALKTVVKYKVEPNADEAKDTYNLRVRSKKWKREIATLFGRYNMVANGI